MAVLCRDNIVKMIGKVSDRLFYAGGFFLYIKVVDSAGST